MNKPQMQTDYHDVWERRFDTEGRLWGDEASKPARFLTKNLLRHRSAILEIGAAYGRDSNWFVENGHNVTAIDKATNALSIATDELKEKIHSDNITFITSDFRRAAIGAKSQDVFYSHRLLHLLGNNGITAAFADMAANVLKTEGRLLVTTRSVEDFNPDQMVWDKESHSVARYRNDIETIGDRRGQVLYLWDKNKLTELFQDDFENIEITNGEENESIGNNNPDGSPVITKYLAISATRKFNR